MSLLDSTYFSRVDCNIPQGTYNTVSEHITRYERDFLIRFLGYDLYALINADATSPTRIASIVSGVEYEVGSYTVKWNGLTNTEKVSPLAYYIYIEYIRNYAIQFQNVGATMSSVENGVVLNASGLIQRASSKMRELVGYPGQDALAPSLYNFMLNNISDYPEWVYRECLMDNTFDV